MFGSSTTTSRPIGSARAATTAMVWGWQAPSTTKRSPLRPRPTRCSRVMASAAAVDSSSSEALARSIAVNSQTMVWKLSSASRRPWDISGW